MEILEFLEIGRGKDEISGVAISGNTQKTVGPVLSAGREGREQSEVHAVT